MLIGRRLNGRYKVLEMIGGGGMANVYLAHDIILDRNVAVKMLRPEFSNDDEFIKRFRREAQSATSLDHPHVVSIFDVGEEDNLYYIIMEYVEGMTLKQFIQQRGAIPVAEALDIMKQLTSAIDHAHQNQLVHRDIKPHNILIDPDGEVKVTDFGIAMALSATSITQTNSVLGSVHYLSPEQARGGMANKKSDIYSLGVVMFELLTGRLPFSGESAVSIALKHLQSETPSPRRWNPSIPQSVENIVLKATAKDSFHRYDNIDNMSEDLETALSPNRMNEGKFTLPDDDEVTKAIPIITDNLPRKTTEDTIIHTSELKKKKSKSKKLFITFMMLIFLIVGSVATAFLILPSLFKQKDVVIPDVTGEKITTALTVLQENGLKVNTEQLYDTLIEEGFVIKTNPPANSSVKEGFEVTVYESLGKQKEKFGDYVGWSLEEAKRELEVKGFNVNNIIGRTVESNKPKNEITAQLQPVPGEEISPDDIGKEWIVFEISEGPKSLMPDMSGWTESEVNDFVDKYKLRLENISERVHSEEIEENLVVSQKPRAKTEIEKGDKIEITLSKGANPKQYTVTKVIPFNSMFGQTEHQVSIYINDLEHTMDEVADSVVITESTEISFDILVPYNGEASYKIHVDEQFFDGAKVEYENIPDQ